MFPFSKLFISVPQKNWSYGNLLFLRNSPFEPQVVIKGARFGRSFFFFINKNGYSFFCNLQKLLGCSRIHFLKKNLGLTKTGLQTLSYLRKIDCYFHWKRHPFIQHSRWDGGIDYCGLCAVRISALLKSHFNKVLRWFLFWN